ncbi:MAG: hypothetical protein PHF31_17215, partial [Methylobacter sp.]|nr:hypothetical protein [Methylobacter sp.]
MAKNPIHCWGLTVFSVASFAAAISGGVLLRTGGWGEADFITDAMAAYPTLTLTTVESPGFRRLRSVPGLNRIFTGT